jgi:hypothetical protein
VEEQAAAVGGIGAADEDAGGEKVLCDPEAGRVGNVGGADEVGLVDGPAFELGGVELENHRPGRVARRGRQEVCAKPPNPEDRADERGGNLERLACRAIREAGLGLDVGMAADDAGGFFEDATDFDQARRRRCSVGLSPSCIHSGTAKTGVIAVTQIVRISVLRFRNLRSRSEQRGGIPAAFPRATIYPDRFKP